jgi:hypothetical protein
MANLKEIAELAWAQLFPLGGDEVAVDREDFVATAKVEHAYQLWRKIKEDKREYGECDIPSYLLKEVELDVKDNQISLEGLNIMRGIDQELWLQDVGGMDCECTYVKSTVNHTKLLCDDDSLPSDQRTFYPMGKKILFPQGTHSDKMKILYAHSGEETDVYLEVDDVIAGIVRSRLLEIYAGKVGAEDKTNDTNTNSK